MQPAMLVVFSAGRRHFWRQGVRSMTPRRFGKSLAIALIVFVITGNAWAAGWKEKVLYSFQGIPDGAVPAGGVVFDRIGNLYGATSELRNCQ